MAVVVPGVEREDGGGARGRRYAGASYELTLLPPTMTFEFPADVKYRPPSAMTFAIAMSIGPFWNMGSSK